jgi:hypothetical protein
MFERRATNLMRKHKAVDVNVHEQLQVRTLHAYYM